MESKPSLLRQKKNADDRMMCSISAILQIGNCTTCRPVHRIQGNIALDGYSCQVPDMLEKTCYVRLYMFSDGQLFKATSKTFPACPSSMKVLPVSFKDAHLGAKPFNKQDTLTLRIELTFHVQPLSPSC